MSKPLHVFLALREGVKHRKTELLTALHRASSRADLYEGLTRTYRPRNEDGDQLPPENKNIQLTSSAVLTELVRSVERDWNTMAVIDVGNQSARADVRVPTGALDAQQQPVYRTVIRDVPVQFLLYLQRELDDVYKFVRELPTLDPAVRWHWDESVAAYVADPTETHRTRKVLKNHVLYEATDRHPAQVQTFTEDVVDGNWTLLRRSGALPLERKTELLERVAVLRDAVKEARQRAAEEPVDDVDVARPIFEYLLGDGVR